MRLRFKRGIIVLFLLGVGGWLTFYGWHQVALIRALAREGVVTTGKVVAHSSGSYSRRSSSYELSVEFSPSNHAAVTTTFAVDGHTYRPAVQSGRVPVRYLPNDPKRCKAGRESAVPYRVILVLGCVMLVGGCVALWPGSRSGFPS